MSEQREKILSEAESMFLKYGFKSITMDDIARELGVSKKTLYQYFTDKNDLVDQCVEAHLSRMRQGCDLIVDEKVDAVTMMLDITNFVSNNIRQVNPSAMYDLKKYFKAAWDKLDRHRREYVGDRMEENFESGKRKGLYRKDLDTKVIRMIYVYLIDFLIDPENHVAAFDFRKMHRELISYHLRSICTLRGLEIMEEKLKETAKN